MAEPEPPPDDDDPADQPRSGRRRKQRKKLPFWKELPILLGIALILTILIQSFVAKVFMIPSGSMEATLHGCPGCTGDRIVVDRLVFDFTDPSPGDVVVFKGPPAWGNEIAPQESGNVLVDGLRGLGSLIGFAPPDERDFVKRIIAVGGQKVECCDAQNRVLVDGKPLDEPYLHWKDLTNQVQETFDPVIVPPGMVWVMGDNRNDSFDSRKQGGGGVNGAVPADNIIGKARFIVLPPGRWGGITDHNPQTGK